jgi:hypothetical protein
MQAERVDKYKIDRQIDTLRMFSTGLRAGSGIFFHTVRNFCHVSAKKYNDVIFDRLYDIKEPKQRG